MKSRKLKMKKTMIKKNEGLKKNTVKPKLLNKSDVKKDIKQIKPKKKRIVKKLNKLESGKKTRKLDEEPQNEDHQDIDEEDQEEDQEEQKIFNINTLANELGIMSAMVGMSTYYRKKRQNKKKIVAVTRTLKVMETTDEFLNLEIKDISNIIYGLKKSNNMVKSHHKNFNFQLSQRINDWMIK